MGHIHDCQLCALSEIGTVINKAQVFGFTVKSMDFAHARTCR